MVGRQTLVDEWRMRLAEWRERLEHGSRRPWLAKLYVRLYTYLVQRYGQNNEDGAALSTAPVDEESSMPFFVARPIEGGRPPRNADRIRAVLDAVHENNPDRAEAGPLAAGLPLDSLIAVAAFYDPVEVKRLRSTLRTEGIESETQPLRKQTQVLVSLANLGRSRPVVDSFLAFKSGDSSAKRRRCAPRCAMFGGLTGFAAGLAAFCWLFDISVGVGLGTLTAIVAAAFGSIMGTIADG